MNDESARRIALTAHAGQRDRFGEPLIEHVARVAAAVPFDVRATAWLHDTVEHARVDVDDLQHRGLTTLELEALGLLSRQPSESYELHALRIAHADGEAGRIARIVKLADLDDHIARGTAPPGAPPYRWARRHIAVAQARELTRWVSGETAPAARIT